MSAPVPGSSVGLLGAGAMGLGMATSLLRAGFNVTVFDPSPAACASAARAGAALAESAAHLLRAHDLVLASLPSETIVRATLEDAVLPACRPGFVFVDLGTTTPSFARWAADLLAGRGGVFLDCPVTGGPEGAAKGNLRVFCAGDEAACRACLPLLSALGAATYCGPSGFGQAAKGVNQLAMGLRNAAYMEVVFYGVKCGLDPKLLGELVGGDSGWRAEVSRACRAVEDASIADWGIKHGQLGMFVEEMRTRDARLPLAEALLAFCEGRPATLREANRQSPRLWEALLDPRRERPPGAAD